jgi:hypothetical protein
MYVCMYVCYVCYVCYVMLCYVMLCYVMLCYVMYGCMYVCMYVCGYRSLVTGFQGKNLLPFDGSTLSN